MALERTCLDLIDVDEHINLYCNLAFSDPVYKKLSALDKRSRREWKIVNQGIEDSIVFQQDLFDNGKNYPRILSIRQKQITKIYQVQFLVFT